MTSSAQARIDIRHDRDHHIRFESSPKRIRMMFNGKTVVDSLCAGLMWEIGRLPVYYFPREDVRMDLLVRTDHHSHCPIRGEASHWTLHLGSIQAENAAWSYEDPPPEAAAIKDWMAFEWQKADHWFEEDEEVFGHARDPYHRIDMRPSTRRVRVVWNGQTLAETRRGIFLFETGLPTRYYIPPADVRMDLLSPSARTSICPYKGTASYWSIERGGRSTADIAWSYLDPLAECPQIKRHLCFYPEKVDRLQVEGETPPG